MDNPNEFEFCALESPPKADSRIGNLLPAWRPRWTGIMPVGQRIMKAARVSGCLAWPEDPQNDALRDPSNEFDGW